MVVGIIPYVLALLSNDRTGLRINGAESKESISRISGGNQRNGEEVVVTTRRVVTRHATGRLQSDVDASSTQKDRPSLAA